MKKILALILSALLLIGMLAACGGDSEKAGDDGDSGKTGLADTWHAEINFGDIADAMGDGLSGEMGGMEEYIDFDQLNMAVVMELKDDGTYSFAVDKDSADDFVKDFKDVVVDGMSAAMEDQTGMSLEEALEMQGKSMDDLNEEFDKQFGSDKIDELVEDSKTEGQYKAEDGKLYTSNDLDEEPGNDYMSYELDGDTLSLDAGSGEVPDELEKLLPLEFERG